MNYPAFSNLTYSCTVYSQDLQSQNVVKVLALRYCVGLSSLFRCELLILDSEYREDVLSWSGCTLNVVINDGYRNQVLCGLISQVSLLDMLEPDTDQGHGYLYQLEVQPRLSLLDMQRDTRSYLSPDADILSVLHVLFEPMGWQIAYQESAQSDVVILLGKEYKNIFRCQYQETALAFIERVFAEQGIYYYFRHLHNKDQLVITDQFPVKQNANERVVINTSRTEQPVDLARLYFDTWSLKKNYLVHKVTVIADDYLSKGKPLRVAEILDQKADQRMAAYCYDIHFNEHQDGTQQTQTEDLMNLRKELISCNQFQYVAGGYTLGINPGDKLLVGRGVNAESNDLTCFITNMNVSLYQQEYKDLISNYWFRLPSTPADFQIEAIPEGVMFRPALIPAPKVPGFLSATTVAIDALSKKQQETVRAYELGQKYYYHVRFSFGYQEIVASREPGSRQVRTQNIHVANTDQQCSGPLPLASSFLGKNANMYFQLLPDTEVLLSYYQGNPDYPVILGALPSYVQGSSVNSVNAGDNDLIWKEIGQMRFTDTPGVKNINLNQTRNMTISNRVNLGSSDGVDSISMSSQGLYKEHILGRSYMESSNVPTMDQCLATHQDMVPSPVSDFGMEKKLIYHQVRTVGNQCHIKKGKSVSYFNQASRYVTGIKSINYYPEAKKSFNTAQWILDPVQDNQKSSSDIVE